MDAIAVTALRRGRLIDLESLSALFKRMFVLLRIVTPYRPSLVERPACCRLRYGPHLRSLQRSFLPDSGVHSEKKRGQGSEKVQTGEGVRQA